MFPVDSVQTKTIQMYTAHVALGAVQRCYVSTLQYMQCMYISPYICSYRELYKGVGSMMMYDCSTESLNSSSFEDTEKLKVGVS